MRLLGQLQGSGPVVVLFPWEAICTATVSQHAMVPCSMVGNSLPEHPNTTYNQVPGSAIATQNQQTYIARPTNRPANLQPIPIPCPWPCRARPLKITFPVPVCIPALHVLSI